MLNHLKDLVENTSGLGLNIIRVTGDVDGKVKFDGIDADKKLVLNGTFHEELPELEGVIGLGNLEWLKGYIKIYNDKADTISVTRKAKTYSMEKVDAQGNPEVDSDGNTVTEEVTMNDIFELEFNRPKPKMKNTYRVASRQMIPAIPTFKGATWNVEVNPSRTSIGLLAAQAGIGYESNFGVKTKDDSLFVTFDDNEQNEFEFASDVTGTLTKPWVWDINLVLSILKLANNASCTMKFSDSGAAMISLDTGLGQYDFILPAKVR